ncbi:hypothetical protein JYG33_03435 [Alcaligenes sp. SORT26]|uniref:hypothetical protein n=1 Tax=Alcaligenes sp. SORT26 TaxID=2813780 RepID=UPI001A9D7CF4|nr:hypothetical protein [Alcaligenes sp. SORT26]QTC00534.1 hypothetical protein JYG33_03435 [Alcaligenes sp. SORT26]
MTQTTSSPNKPQAPPQNPSPSSDRKAAMHPDDKKDGKKDDKSPQAPPKGK